MLRKAVPSLRRGAMGEIAKRIAEKEGVSSMPRPVQMYRRGGGALTERNGETMSWGKQGEPIRTPKNGGASSPQVRVGGRDVGRRKRVGRGAGDRMYRSRGPERGGRGAGTRGSVKLAPHDAGGDGGGVRPPREENETGA